MKLHRKTRKRVHASLIGSARDIPLVRRGRRSELHASVAVSLELADQSECVHRQKSNATVVRCHQHALRVILLEKRNSSDLTTLFVLSIAISTFCLRFRMNNVETCVK